MNHSFHFFHNSVTFDKLNNNILDKNGILVLKICNLCNIPGLYMPVLEKTMIKKKSLINYKKFFGFRDINSQTVSNYKIKVNINFKEIRNLLLSGREIPQRNSLFKLLRRNIRDKLKKDELIHTLPNQEIVKVNKLITYYSDSIINCEGLYFDIQLERIYLSSLDILRNKYNTIPNESFYFYQSRDKLESFFNCFDCNRFVLLTEYPQKYLFLKKHINNIVFLDSSKNYTFGELENKSVIIDFTKLVQCEENTENFIECRKYEYSFLQAAQKSKKIVIPQLLNYNNVILDDSLFNSNKIGKREIIRSFIGDKNTIILSRFFYKYRISDFKYWFDEILDKSTVVSRDLVCKLVSMSNKEKVKLTSRDHVKTFTLENFEKEYFNQNFNKYTFNIEEFNSLPYNFIKEKYKTITFLPEEACGICYDELTTKNISVTSTCNHYFCINCLEKAVHIKKECPLCRTTTGVCHAVFNDISDFYGKKIKFINDFLIKNKNLEVTIISKFEKTRNTLREIYMNNEEITIEDYKYIENNIDNNTIFFMEELGEEYKYLKYLIGSNKSFSLALKLVS